jgi:hypothetical protein
VSFEHDGEMLFIERASYADGSLAVLAVDVEGLPYATVSVRMPGEQPPEGVFFLKDWSENVGVAASLRASGLIEPADVPDQSSGFIVARAWRFV